MEQLGLFGDLTFNEKQAVSAMGRARMAFGRLNQASTKLSPAMAAIGTATQNMAARSVQAFRKITSAAARMATSVGASLKRMKNNMAQVGKGLSQVGGAMRSAAMAALPATVGMALGAKTAANFESQMSAVSSITQLSSKNAEEHAANMSMLERKAKKMGIESAFSATESGQAMEYMARAGATATEIVSGLDGVMNAAAADGMGLAEAANTISQVVRGMGLGFEQSSHVADVLAMASAKGNTNISQLGESMRYAMAQAKSMGIPLEQVVASLTKAADAGLQGSIGGTSFTNMLVKLSKPSAKAAAQMKAWGIKLTDSKKRMKSMGQIVNMFKKRLDGIKDPVERARMATELFGIRGAKAYSALASQGGEALDRLTGALKSSEGAAARMAEERLDNVLGQLTLLKSSVSGFFIELFGPLMKPMAKALKELIKGINSVVFAIQAIKDVGSAKTMKELNSAMDNLTKASSEYGSTVMDIAWGVMDAIKWMKDGWNSIVSTIKNVAKWFGVTFGKKGGLRDVTAMIIKIGVVAAALAPIALVLGGLAFVITSVVIPAITGIFAAFTGVLGLMMGPFGIAVLLLINHFKDFKKENETWMQAASRAWKELKAWVLDVWNNAIKPFWQGMKDAFGPILSELRTTWNDTMNVIRTAMDDMGLQFSWLSNKGQTDWREIGRTVVNVIGSIVTGVAKMVGTIVQFFAWMATVVEKYIKRPFMRAWDGIVRFKNSVVELFTVDFIQGLKGIGAQIVDTLMKPFRHVFIALEGLFKKAGMEVPAFFKFFTESAKRVDLAERLEKAGIYATPGNAKQKAAEVARAAAAARLQEEAKFEAIRARAQKKKRQAATIPRRRRLESGTQMYVDKARELAALEAKAKGSKASKSKVEADIKTKLEGCIKNDIKLNMDGRDTAVATERHRKEISERAGFKATPWARQMAMDHAVAK